MADIKYTLLDKQVLGLQEAIAQTMRKSGYAPVRTGRLRKSIKTLPIVDTPKGIQAPISYINYGVYPDLGTKYQSAQRFTQRAQETELKKQQQAIAEAAGQDVANYIDDILPDNIDVTLDL